jgi:hypothetical protein
MVLSESGSGLTLISDPNLERVGMLSEGILVARLYLYMSLKKFLARRLKKLL